jgi:hypothetical protein
MNLENKACNCSWLVELSTREEGRVRCPGEL